LKVLTNLNKSLADNCEKQNQPISFPTAPSSKKSAKLPKNNKTKKPSGLGFFKKPGFVGAAFYRPDAFSVARPAASEH